MTRKKFSDLNDWTPEERAQIDAMKQPAEAQPQVCANCGMPEHRHNAYNECPRPTFVPAPPAAPRCNENVAGGGTCERLAGHSGPHSEAAPGSGPLTTPSSVTPEGVVQPTEQPMSAWGWMNGKRPPIQDGDLLNRWIIGQLEAFAAHRTAALEQENARLNSNVMLWRRFQDRSEAAEQRQAKLVGLLREARQFDLRDEAFSDDLARRIEEAIKP